MSIYSLSLKAKYCKFFKQGADHIAAKIIEPIQGEGGFIVPPKEFLPGLKTICEKNKNRSNFLNILLTSKQLF